MWLRRRDGRAIRAETRARCHRDAYTRIAVNQRRRAETDACLFPFSPDTGAAIALYLPVDDHIGIVRDQHACARVVGDQAGLAE